MHSPGSRLDLAVPESVGAEVSGDASDTVLDGPWALERSHANVAQTVEEAVLPDAVAESGVFGVVNRPPDVDRVTTGMQFIGEPDVADECSGEGTAKENETEYRGVSVGFA